MTSKCCFFVPLRVAALLFGVLSLLARLQFVYNWVHFFSTDENRTDTSNVVSVVIQILAHGVVANVADVLLIYGVLKKVQKWVGFYQLAIIFVFSFEIVLFVALFVLGHHWLDIIVYLIHGLFHLWAWFTIKKLNANWDEEMQGTRNPEELNSL